jgi:hypothetical protein
MRPAWAAGARSVVRQRIAMSLLLAGAAGTPGVELKAGDEMSVAGAFRRVVR